VLPKLASLDANVISAEITDSRFYLKAVSPRIVGSVKTGDDVQAGIVVSNSEVGLGSFRIEEMTYRLLCLNGAIHEAAVRKTHLGRSAGGLDAIENAREFFRDETRLADDRAFFLKVRDATGAIFDPARFNKRLLQYQDATTRIIESDPVKVVELAAKRFDLNDSERGGVLQHLIRGGDLSAFGLMNAVTRYSQDATDYDRATQLEAIGPKVIELSPTQWKDLTSHN
jgi:hypothetical protein